MQDPIPEVVSVRPVVTEKWMDRFVVDLVESPSVSRKSALALTFGPAVSEEYSPVVFAGGGGGCRCIPPGGRRVVESDSALVSGVSGTERCDYPPTDNAAGTGFGGTSGRLYWHFQYGSRIQ